MKFIWMSTLLLCAPKVCAMKDYDSAPESQSNFLRKIDPTMPHIKVFPEKIKNHNSKFNVWNCFHLVKFLIIPVTSSLQLISSNACYCFLM